VELTCDLIREQVELDTPKPDGSTQRQHLEQAQRMTKKRIERLEPKTIPGQCQSIYRIFTELSRTRAGMKPICFQEIKAYCDLTGYKLSQRELETIQKFDSVLLHKTIEVQNHYAKMSVDKK
jgi:hypothetical protein